MRVVLSNLYNMKKLRVYLHPGFSSVAELSYSDKLYYQANNYNTRTVSLKGIRVEGGESFGAFRKRNSDAFLRSRSTSRCDFVNYISINETVRRVDTERVSGARVSRRPPAPAGAP